MKRNKNGVVQQRDVPTDFALKDSLFEMITALRDRQSLGMGPELEQVEAIIRDATFCLIVTSDVLPDFDK